MTPTDIAPLDPAAIRLLEQADQLAAVAQRRADVYERIKAIAIQATSVSDWVLMGEHCHLGEAGAKKVARVCGVSVGRPREEKRTLEADEKHGTGYLYRVEMEFCVGRLESSPDVITEIGVASSRDSFFAETGRGENKIYLSSWEVDEANIIKKGHTNCFIRGVTSLLGIRNVTPDQLKAAGLDVSRLKGINYAAASKGGRGQQDSATLSASDLDAIKAQRGEIRKLILEMAEGDVDGAKQMLQALTAFTGKDKKEVPGVPSVDALNPPRLGIALERVRKEYDEWRSKGETNG